MVNQNQNSPENFYLEVAALIFITLLCSGVSWAIVFLANEFSLTVDTRRIQDLGTVTGMVLGVIYLYKGRRHG